MRSTEKTVEASRQREFYCVRVRVCRKEESQTPFDERTACSVRSGCLTSTELQEEKLAEERERERSK